MPRLPLKHAIWDTYQLLTRDLGVDHDTAMTRLEALAPTMPVAVIVEAEGDLGRTFELLTGTPPAVRPGNGQPDPRLLKRQVREAIIEAATADPDDFNAQIRARAAGLDRSVTVDSSDPAAAYDPAADFIRQRFAERTG